jgi:hypothetical protein
MLRISALLFSLVLLLQACPFEGNETSGESANNGKKQTRSGPTKEECIASLVNGVQSGNFKLAACGYDSPNMEARAFNQNSASLEIDRQFILGREEINLSVSDKMNLQGLLLTRSFVARGRSVRIAGYVIALGHLNIECSSCDLSNGLFFGSGEWLLNGQICHADSNHKLVCEEKNRLSLSDRLKLPGCIEELEILVRERDGNLSRCGVNRVDERGMRIDRHAENIEVDQKIWNGEEKIRLVAEKSMAIDGVFASPEFVLIAPKVKLSGAFVAWDSGTITCEECDFSAASFYGLKSWWVNSEECQVESHKLICKGTSPN